METMGFNQDVQIISFDAEKASRYIRQAMVGFLADNPDSDYQRGFLAALLIVYREGLGKDADRLDDRLNLLDRLTRGGAQ